MSINLDQAYDKTQCQFIVSKLGIENIPLNVIKNVYKNPTCNIKCTDERLDAFPLISGTRQGCSSHHC